MLWKDPLLRPKKTEAHAEDAESFDGLMPAPALLPIKPPANQVSTLHNLNGDKSHALPFSPSGLSHDYWGS